jgi:hypothetical protein
MNYTFEKEFRTDHPETINETDKQFDLVNYTQWIENKLSQQQTTQSMETKVSTKSGLEEVLGNIQMLIEFESRIAENLKYAKWTKTPDGVAYAETTAKLSSLRQVEEFTKLMISREGLII